MPTITLSAAARRAHAPMRWRTELALFGAVYLVYVAARWLAAGELGPAVEHARWLIDLEHDLGVAIERDVQRSLDGEAFMWLMSNVYLAAQLVVVPGALVWLYRRSPAIYRRLRDTVLATWLLAVPVFTLFPVAPPRLAGIGLADSVSEQAGVALTGRSTLFYNPFAAVPSLHCGFAFAVGIALAASARRRSTRIAALLWGPLVSLTVVVTGNHYVLDIVAGLAVTVAGLLVGRAWFWGTLRSAFPSVLRDLGGSKQGEAPDVSRQPSREAWPMPSTFTFRPARDDERDVVRRLAHLDSAPVPQGDVMLAIESGRPVAAMSLRDGRVVADPFVPTAATVELLRKHVGGVREGRVETMRAGAATRRRRRVRRASLRFA